MCLLIINFIMFDFGTMATTELEIAQLLNICPLIITLFYYLITDD